MSVFMNIVPSISVGCASNLDMELLREPSCDAGRGKNAYPVSMARDLESVGKVICRRIRLCEVC